MTDAEQTLFGVLDKELDKRGYRPRDVKVKPISSGGANYTSKLFLVDVTTPKEDLKLFAKVAIIAGQLRQTMSADWLFATERLTYTKIAKFYEDLQVKHNLSEEVKLKFPKFYGCNDEYGKETVIMENLVASGYKPFNRLKCIDWQHASASVEYLAKFHALSFALAKDLPEEFKGLSDIKYEIGSKQTDDEISKSMWEKIIKGAIAVVKDEHKSRVINYFQNMPKFNTYNKPIGKPVLSHGDFRVSNLLFKAENEKVQAIAVDFQTVYAGCPATDLVYLIFLGSDEEFRAEYYEKLLDHYYTSLSKMMEWLSIDSTEVYPREEFDRDMKENLPYAVLIGATILPTVVVEEDAAPDLGNFDYNQFVMSPNEIFAKRFRGIVNDCIRWNVI
ncbi:uncharacterized protein LOC111000168 isoform X1 [Pieris rapae]|uniref:uncharacterized protein LOC111000168 isoform X1 n=1 Tax=Pieris rapae TaxID=64459 RepID=UPI001E280798|nr:uncharacterized protein LOC111000168 isoform X1 [Pieris rapae]